MLWAGISPIKPLARIKGASHVVRSFTFKRNTVQKCKNKAVFPDLSECDTAVLLKSWVGSCDDKAL